MGCSRQDSAPVLARVGDTEITTEDFLRYVKEHAGNSLVKMDSKALLQELVDREVMVQNAFKSGLAEDTKVKELIRDVLIAELKKRQLDQQMEAAKISVDELKAAYESEKEKLMKPERLRLAMLFLQKPAQDDKAGAKEVQRRLETAVGLARQKAAEEEGAIQGFGPLSVAYSEDQESRYRGGDIGWVESDRHAPRLDHAAVEAGFALKSPGDISDVVKGRSGFYVVKLLERQVAAPTSLEQAEPSLRRKLLDQKQQQILTSFQSDLRKGLHIEVHADRLKDLQAAASQETLPPSIP